MPVLLLFLHSDPELCSRHPSPLHAIPRNHSAGGKRIKRASDRVPVRARIGESPHQHVAGKAGKGIYIGNGSGC
jgi:hypothetical protein